MSQMYTEPSKQELREEIAEHIAEPTKSTKQTLKIEGLSESELKKGHPLLEKSLPEKRFYDRELSWLLFNKRVMELEEDPGVPLLERASFASIFASNLNEYFMVRVAGLKRRIQLGIAKPSPAGLSAAQQLHAIADLNHQLQAEHARYTLETLMPELAAEGIELLRWNELSISEQEELTQFFHRQVFPVLTPLAVDPAHPFPYISGNSLNLAVLVQNPTSGKSHFARVKIPDNISRLIPISDKTGIDPATGKPRFCFLTMENLINAHLDALFPGMKIQESRSFRVTRNEDIDLEDDDDDSGSLLTTMEHELQMRRFGPPVRLELSENTSQYLSRLLADKLGVTADEVYRLPIPLDLTLMSEIHHDVDRPDLKYPPYYAPTNAQIANVRAAGSQDEDVFAAIREGDILLHHPYESFQTSVVRFVQQAAADPNVLAIKQTIYRTSDDSAIVNALIDAAHRGKQVLALVEIKARFDEQNNISWARRLEHAGVHVVYGIVGLKTHCKLLLVVRRENGQLRRYCHVGTGNYNPKTARQYTDLGLLTCDPVVGQDLTRLFNQLSGYAPQENFHRLLVAPRGIRTGLIARIRREEKAALDGHPAWIKIKVNSLVDEDTIDALYRASQAGVKIDCVVRGICCLKPGIPRLSENIRVHSILGRFLEHSRIFAFANSNGPQIGEGPASGPEVWIGSADIMHRNLDSRVEALIRITSPNQIKQLIDYVDLQMSDKTSSWHEQQDGSYVRHNTDKDGKALQDAQVVLMRRRRHPGKKND
jgi:polyphosphate kinase